jgi:acetyl esterase/lipase
MRLITESITGLDGTTATLNGYVIDNCPDMDEHRVRPAILILPGGAYAFTSPREAEPVALQMLAQGYQAFVLDYSCAPSTYPTQLAQTAAAMQLIRSHSEQWHIDPDSIIVGGFSAGGHLAAHFAESWNGATLGDLGFSPESIRPNGLLLAYPVITSGEFAHRGSMDNLLGDRKTDPQALNVVSLEKHVTTDVPPTFLWGTMTDNSVPIENSLAFIAALHRAGVSVEAHLFPQGRHGLSLGTWETCSHMQSSSVEPCVQSWPRLFGDWMARNFRTVNGHDPESPR